MKYIKTYENLDTYKQNKKYCNSIARRTQYHLRKFFDSKEIFAYCYPEHHENWDRNFNLTIVFTSNQLNQSKIEILKKELKTLGLKIINNSISINNIITAEIFISDAKDKFIDQDISYHSDKFNL